MPSIDGIRWVELKACVDPRGTLTAIEAAQTVPFDIQRVYFMHSLSADRAGHAHRDTRQLLLALAGSCTIVISNGFEDRSFHCDSPERGLYICPMMFIRVTKISPGAIILVLASTHYDKSRSIRSWDEYLREVR